MMLDILYSSILLFLAITVSWSFLILLGIILILGYIIRRSGVEDFVITSNEEDDSGEEL